MLSKLVSYLGKTYDQLLNHSPVLMNSFSSIQANSKKNACIFSLFCFISIFLIFIVEFSNPISSWIIITLPFVAIAVVYNIAFFVKTNQRILIFLGSAKKLLSLACFLFFLCITCIPVNEFTKYLGGLYPFKFYNWLIVTLIGILFSVAFLNYAFVKTEGWWIAAVKACSKVWQMKVSNLLILASLWIFIITNIFSYAIFEHIPHIQDSIAQLFQAKIFAQGRLTVAPPPIPEFFQYFYDNIIITENKWYSQYPPGHPFFLMLGVLVGAPWIINPFFASLSVFVLYKATSDYLGKGEAKLSIVLFCISPFVLFMSSSFMNHVPTLFFELVFLCCLVKCIKNKKVIYAFAAGLSLGIMCNIRPSDAFAIGSLFSLLFFIYSVRNKIYFLSIAFSTGLIFMIIILLLYNYKTNGDPLLFGYTVRWGPNHTIGFHNGSAMDTPRFTPLRGVIHTFSNIIALNHNLFEWPFPSLLPTIIFFIPFVFKKNKKHYVLLCGFLAPLIFYFFYFYQDLCLGPRFYYASLPFAIILTAHAILRLTHCNYFVKAGYSMQIKRTAIALLFFFFVFAFLVRMPVLCKFYANTYWNVDNKIMNKAKELKINNAIIFLKSSTYKDNDLGAGFLHNDPTLNNSILFARDLKERNIELARFFSYRSYYIASRDKNGDIVIEPLILF